MSSHVVIEWAPFVVKDGVDETKLLHASEALQTEFLSKQDGFLRRELLRGKGKQWVDAVYWRDLRAAEQAMNNAAESPVCFAYFQLMEGADHVNAGDGVTHFAQVKSYE